MAETFAGKLAQMRADLNSIVERMNRDESYEIASLAQGALVAVAAVENADPWLEDLAWDWQPSEAS